jgi:hypothetical protein
MEANFDKRVEEKVKEKVKEMLASKGALEPIGTSTGPQVMGRSSYKSTPPDNVEVNVPHLSDNITKPMPVKLYIHQQWTTDKVALGQA